MYVQGYTIGREREFPTSLLYCVTTCYGGHDLCNHNIHKFEFSQLATCPQTALFVNVITKVMTPVKGRNTVP